jgi:hypothetical protein
MICGAYGQGDATQGDLKRPSFPALPHEGPGEPSADGKFDRVKPAEFAIHDDGKIAEDFY